MYTAVWVEEWKGSVGGLSGAVGILKSAKCSDGAAGHGWGGFARFGWVLVELVRSLFLNLIVPTDFAPTLIWTQKDLKNIQVIFYI